MEATKLMEILEEMDLPVTNTNFPPNKKIKPPFIVFVRNEVPRFLADNKVYKHYDKYNVELYTECKNQELENKLINIFDKHEIVWEYLADERIQEGLNLVIFRI